MPNRNLNYMTLNQIYRSNPYHKKGTALMEASKSAGFASPFLAYYAGQQMAKAGEHDERVQARQDAIQERLVRTEQRTGQLKAWDTLQKLLDKEQFGLAVNFVNQNKDLFGMDPKVMVESFSTNPKGGFKNFVLKGANGERVFGAVDKRGNFFKAQPDPTTGQLNYQPAGADDFKMPAGTEKKTTAILEFERANTDPAFKEYLIKTGKMVDPDAKEGVGKRYIVNAQGIARPMKDNEGNDVLTGDKKNSFVNEVSLQQKSGANAEVTKAIKDIFPQKPGAPGAAPATPAPQTNVPKVTGTDINAVLEAAGEAPWDGTTMKNAAGRMVPKLTPAQAAVVMKAKAAPQKGMAAPTEQPGLAVEPETPEAIEPEEKDEYY